MIKKKKKIFLIVILSFIFLINFISAVDVGYIGELGIDLVPEVPINYSTVYVNASDFWDNLDTPADLLLSMFAGASWIDTKLDLNFNNIDNVGEITDLQNNITATASPQSYLKSFKGIETGSVRNFILRLSNSVHNFFFKSSTGSNVMQINDTAVTTYVPLLAESGLNTTQVCISTLCIDSLSGVINNYTNIAWRNESNEFSGSINITGNLNVSGSWSCVSGLNITDTGSNLLLSYGC